MELFWTAFEEVWKIGTAGGWRFLGTFIATMVVLQTLWLMWRWIDDAEERENRPGSDHIPKKERRRVFIGDLLDTKNIHNAFRTNRHSVADFYATIVIIYGIVGGILIFLWPVAIVIGIIWCLLQSARGFRRLQKTVVKMITTLKTKADKSHDHDGVYVAAVRSTPKRTEDGSLVDLHTDKLGR